MEFSPEISSISLCRLCLANSERIKYTPYMHMVFEVQDLASASPATVSRYVLKRSLCSRIQL